ncbi:hypothetical protein KR032_005724 [Drosophila birchii]|nr:hypothetical protein KR032_005724 [Drosophila birchii]
MLAKFSLTPAPELLELYGLLLSFLGPSNTTVFYFNPSSLSCHWELLQRERLFDHPQIVWRKAELYPNLYNQHNSNIFVLTCLSSSFYESQLKILATTLTQLRSVRVLIEMEEMAESFSMASEILSFCQQHSMLNVGLYFRSRSVFSYRAFPYFKLIQQRISEETQPRIFTNQVADLRGYQLRVQPDLSLPNSFLYRDSRGRNRVSGFMWLFISTFAKKLGAGIEILYPTWKKSKVPSSEYMLEFTRNGSSDFGLTPNSIEYKHEERFRDYSYPLIPLHWCTMLPIEEPLSTHSLFTHILSCGSAILLAVMYLVCFLIIPALIRFLGFISRDIWLRLSSRLFVLVMICGCSAQLLSLLIFPPIRTRIRSFDDLLASGLKIFGMRSEFYYQEGGFRAKYAAAFRLTDNYDELYDHRNYFNTTYAYTITSVKWMVIEAQQRHFARPVFRFSKDLCFSWGSPMGMLIAQESVYRERFHHYTLMVGQSGLIGHWMTQSYYDLVKAGRMIIKDYSLPRTVLPIRLQDLCLCWRVLGSLLLIASAAFALELLVFYTNVFLNSL